MTTFFLSGSNKLNNQILSSGRPAKDASGDPCDSDGRFYAGAHCGQRYDS